MNQICIIVPVYNEELSVDTFFDEFLKFKEALVIDFAKNQCN